VPTVSALNVGTETRIRLLDATIEVIETRSDSVGRTVEVANAAGIKQASSYYFFPSCEASGIATHLERYRRSVAEGLDAFETEFEGAATQAELVDAAKRAVRSPFVDEWREVRASPLTLLARALTNDELRREVNEAAVQGHLASAAIIERVQVAGCIRCDVSALTLTRAVRTMIFGRASLELDRGPYDGGSGIASRSRRSRSSLAPPNGSRSVADAGAGHPR